MKTQRLNLLEAMNFALAWHEVVSYTGHFTLKLKNGKLAVYHNEFPRGRNINGGLINFLKDCEWHAGDDRTIKGYYEEE